MINMKKNDYYVRIESPKPCFLDSDHELYEADKIVKYDYLYMYEDKFVFTPAILTINQFELKEVMEWKLWVKIPAKEFIEMTENIDKFNASITGNICSEILFYEKTKELKVKLVFELGREIEIPKIHILDNHAELFSDFISGISKDKYLQWQKELGV